MYRAVIDLGSNLFQLFIVDAHNQYCCKEEVFVNIGQDAFVDKVIKEPAIERALVALQSFKRVLTQYGIEQCPVIATSAIRDARNTTFFCQRIQEKTGFEVTVIAGDQEALYIYQGIAHAGLCRDATLVIDIGGGSVECVFCRESSLQWQESFPLGVTRLMENFAPSDPISTEQIEEIENHLTQFLLEPILKQGVHLQEISLLGCSGAFETYRDMLFAKHEKSFPYVQQLELPKEAVLRLSDQLIFSSREQRLRMQGLATIRVNTVFLGALLIRFLLYHLPVKKIIQTDITLKEGVLLAHYASSEQ